MKPCIGNRKNLALLAASALNSAASNKLREHIITCAGCREYFREISGVASRLSNAQAVSEIEATERFHQKLVGRIRATEKEPATSSAFAFIAAILLQRRVIVPALSVFLLVAAIAGLSLNRGKHLNGNTSSSLAAAPANDISPTFANFQNAANRSLDQFDSLLTRQAREGFGSSQIYKASATSLAQEKL